MRSCASLFSFPSIKIKKKSMSHGTFDERSPAALSSGGFFGVDDGTGQGVLVRERHQSRSSFGDVWTLSTLDESISKTFKRDVDRIASNVWNVLDAKRVFCFFWRTREEEENGESSTTQNNNAPLRDWDLYGPLLFVLLFGVCLATSSSSSSSSSDAGTIFSVVFATVAFGGVALTLNVKFLGGKIVFLQAMSLIGYCIFPLDASAALCRASSNAVYRLIVVGVGVLWSAAASVPFVSAAVVEERKALAVYPMVLLYVTLGLFAAVVA